MELSLSERIMLSTTRIVVLDSADHVLGTATGFFFMFSYNYITGSFIPALVTNRHVFEIGSKIAINITRKSESGEPEVGKFDRIILPFHAVIYHPDLEIDLAVIPIGETLRSLSLENKHYAISYLNKAYIPTLDEWNAFNAIEEVTMFGHPKGLADEVNNLPIFRKGITATHPRYDLNGKPWFMIEIGRAHV